MRPTGSTRSSSSTRPPIRPASRPRSGCPTGSTQRLDQQRHGHVLQAVLLGPGRSGRLHDPGEPARSRLVHRGRSVDDYTPRSRSAMSSASRSPDDTTRPRAARRHSITNVTPQRDRYRRLDALARRVERDRSGRQHRRLRQHARPVPARSPTRSRAAAPAWTPRSQHGRRSRASSALTFRVPSTLVDQLDMAATCTVVATNIPFDRFKCTAELGAYVDRRLHDEHVPGAGDRERGRDDSATTINVAFTRHIDPATFDGTATSSCSTGPDRWERRAVGAHRHAHHEPAGRRAPRTR